MRVRCGNHGDKIYHDSAQAVRACYASHFSRKRITEALTEPAEPEIALPAWMTDEDPRYVRPLPSQRRRMRGWWELPIAETMWGADAREVGA